jgi:hypothetical protein
LTAKSRLTDYVQAEMKITSDKKQTRQQSEVKMKMNGNSRVLRGFEKIVYEVEVKLDMVGKLDKQCGAIEARYIGRQSTASGTPVELNLHMAVT